MRLVEFNRVVSPDELLHAKNTSEISGTNSHGDSPENTNRVPSQIQRFHSAASWSNSTSASRSKNRMRSGVAIRRLSAANIVSILLGNNRHRAAESPSHKHE